MRKKRIWTAVIVFLLFLECVIPELPPVHAMEEPREETDIVDEEEENETEGKEEESGEDAEEGEGDGESTEKEEGDGESTEKGEGDGESTEEGEGDGEDTEEGEGDGEDTEKGEEGDKEEGDKENGDKEDGEDKEEIVFPEICLKSAVNDAGSTVVDADGACCFREFVKIVLLIGEKESDREDWKGRFVIRRDGVDLACTDGYFTDRIEEDGEYIYTVVYTEEGMDDITGENTLNVRTRKVMDSPSVSVIYDSDSVEADGKRYFSEDPEVRFRADSGAGIAMAEYREEDGEYVIWKDFRKEGACYVYGGQTALEEDLKESDEFMERLTDMQDGNCRITFRVTDVLGGNAEADMEFTVDKTPPDSQVFVSYQSDGTNPASVSSTGIMDFIHSLTDRLFGKREVEFDLYVTDGKGRGEEPSAVSGIDVEDLYGQIVTADGKISVQKLQILDKGGASFTYEGEQYRNYVHLRGCMAMPSDRGQNITDRLQIKRLKDRAGNVTYGLETENMTGTTVIYMDQENPALSVDYGEGIVDEEKKTVFYMEGSAVKLILQEKNYLNYVGEDGSPVTPRVEFTDYGDFGASVKEWNLLEEKNQARTELLFPAAPDGGEAVYDFTVGYEDGAGNPLETGGAIPGSMENGVYTGCTVVIDDRPPELTMFSVDGNVSGQSGGMDVYRNIEGEDVKLSFGIDDHAEYWNPEAVTLTIWNMDTGKEAAVITGGSLQWKEDGRNHLAEYLFDGEEGMTVSGYRVTISYKDRAGNRMVGRGTLNDRTEEGMYTAQGFLLDHEAPDFHITFSDAARLVRDGDTDPSEDIRNVMPRAGYTAYYADTIEVFFSIRERCACPVYEKGVLTGLQDFQLIITGKDGSVHTPAVCWDKKKESYEGRFSLAEEGRYTVSVRYKDMAGNRMVSGEVSGSREETGTLKDGSYVSVPLILDRTAPILRISCVNIDKNDKSGEVVRDENSCRYFSEPVYLKLEVQDENLRFHELLQKLEGTCTTDRAGNSIRDNSVRTFLEKLDGARIAEGGVTWYLPLVTEAVFEIPFGCEDLSGNGSEQIVERVCVDGTEPEMELSYSVEKSGFLDVFRYGDLRYLFADGRMTIKTSAADQISGIRSVCCKAEEENGKITEKTMDFAPASDGEFEMNIPFDLSDFKGTVTAEVKDWSGNRAVRKCTAVVEGDERHRQEGSAVIVTDTSPSRTVGGVDYYNTDIKFRLMVQDTYSGLKSVTCRGGNGLDYHREYGPENNSVSQTGDIVYECREELVLDAASNNENEVPVRVDYQDLAGHGGMAEQFYNIDRTVPVIEVEYDNCHTSDQGLYSEGRRATVSIRERNFDPADVEFQITSTDGTMPSIGNWQESGTGDDTLHVCHVDFFADGDYTFTLEFTDLAGNRAEYGKVDEFTIDQTEPVMIVNFDNEKSHNNEYYAKGRTAVIDILEHNFDASLVQILATERNGIQIPDISGWREEGDHHVAVVSFDADGDYTFEITGTDQAGNRMDKYEAEHFIIDQTAPVLEITGLEHRSANKGAVTPVIRCMDANYQKGDMKIQLEGSRSGLMEWKGRRIQSEEGEMFLAEDFPSVPAMDDLYRLSVSVSDLAGNVSHEEIQFSVNRFGSVYTLGAETELLVGSQGVYYTNKEQDIVLTETNVDTLEFLEISCNRNGKLMTLSQGEDYYVHAGSTDAGWKQYVYTIPGRNFTEEGTYILTVYSEDRAENASDNQTKGKKLEFVMDKTAPSILLSGLEDGGQYRENSREITLDIQDNVRMSEVKVKINGIVSVYSESEVLEQDGRLTLLAEGANRWQTLQVTALDAAGNQKELGELRFLLTPDLLVQFVMERFLLLRLTCGFTLVCIGMWQLFLRRKRFRKCMGRVQ